MKWLLTIAKDLGLLIILGLFLVGAVWGVRVPYRNPFLGTGDYQLEVFPTGMAIYQYNRVSPFYRILPLSIETKAQPKYQQLIAELLVFFQLKPLEYQGQQVSLQKDGWIRLDQTDTTELIRIKFNASDTVDIVDETVVIQNSMIPGRLIIAAGGGGLTVQKIDQVVMGRSPLYLKGEE